MLTKVLIIKAMVFQVVMYGYEGWTIKKSEHQRMMLLNLVLEKTFESPLDVKEIKLVNPIGNQPEYSSGRSDAEAEAIIF